MSFCGCACMCVLGGGGGGDFETCQFNCEFLSPLLSYVENVKLSLSFKILSSLWMPAYCLLCGCLHLIHLLFIRFVCIFFLTQRCKTYCFSQVKRNTFLAVEVDFLQLSV